MSWYLDVLKKYAVFDGRAGRPEYWYFFLFNLIVSLVLSIVDAIVGTTSGGFGVLSGLYSLAVLLPAIGVGIRRLHDIGKSGWWLLIGVIPIVGWIILIVLAARESDGPNAYGVAPALAPA